MSTPDYDFCFLGCGASTVLHLLTHQEFFSDKRILILESSESFQLKRTFCSFSELAIPAQGEIKFHSFSASGWDFVRHFESTPIYRCLDAGALFAEFEKLLKRAPHIELRLGQSVERLKRRGELFEVAGELARFVFDSRSPELSGRIWRQHFVGWEIEFESSQPLASPVIMDIDDRFREGLKFFYLIPKSPRKLLVELTYFSENAFDDSHYEAELERYLKSRGWAKNRVVAKEQGVIPLVSISPPSRLPARYRPLGVRAGHLRASTGYSVWRSFAQSRRGGPVLSTRSDLYWKLIQAMDRLFLKVLQLHPQRAGSLFLRFFRGLDGKTISSFMSERPQWSSLLKVIAVMPKWLFLKSIFCRTPFSNHQRWSIDL